MALFHMVGFRASFSSIRVAAFDISSPRMALCCLFFFFCCVFFSHGVSFRMPFFSSFRRAITPVDIVFAIDFMYAICSHNVHRLVCVFLFTKYFVKTALI